MTKEKLTVIKIGGNIIDSAEKLSNFLNLFCSVEGAKILVHGGGLLATELAHKLDVPVKLIDGRRVTGKETIKIATMVYAGFINKNIVAQLQGLGINSIGLSGADANCILSNKRVVEGFDYGYVGDIAKINTDFFKMLLQNQYLPVISAITHDGKGQLLNTNADTIASKIASALSVDFDVNLIYCFEKKGVLNDISNENSIIHKMDRKLYESLKSDKKIHSGMIPKIDNAFESLAYGVKMVKIGDAEELLNLINENELIGTKFI